MAIPALRGRFVWHELMVPDTDPATRFYPSITGWKVQAYEADASYRLWMTGSAPMGGLMRLPEEARRTGSPPSWLMYVGVPDVDATVRQATALGARTRAAARDLPVGRFAVLADPQGAAFAVFKPSMPPRGGEEAGIGDFSWHELATTDWKAAWEFYRALFGWEKRDVMDVGPAGTYWMFGLPGGSRTLGGMYNKTPETPRPHWLPYVRVPNADRAAAETTRLGGRVVTGPMDVPGGGRIAMCVDPQGVAFAVHSVVAVAAAPPRRPKAKPKAKAKAKSKSRASAKRKSRRPKRPARRKRR